MGELRLDTIHLKMMKRLEVKVEVMKCSKGGEEANRGEHKWRVGVKTTGLKCMEVTVLLNESHQSSSIIQPLS